MDTNATPTRSALSPAQLRYWVGQQRDPEKALYNMAVVSRIHGALDPHRMSRAWLAVLTQYPDLNSTIESESGEPVRLIGPPKRKLLIVDLSSEANPEQSCENWVQARCEQVFDLTQSMQDAALIRLAADRWTWYCCLHHLICDASSFEILWRTLATNYADESTDAPAVAPVRADYAGQTAIETPAALTPRSQGPELNLYGTSVKRPSTASIRIKLDNSLAIANGLELASKLPQARSLSADLSRSIVLAASLFAYLYRITVRNEITIGLLISTRGRSQANKVPGLFVELLPITLRIGTQDTLADLQSNVREALLDALKQPLSANSIRERQSRVSVVLNLVTAELRGFGELPASHQWLHPGHADRHHILRLHATRWNDGAQLSFAFDANQTSLPGALSHQAIQHWQSCFDAIVAQPEIKPGEIQLVPRQAVSAASHPPVPAVLSQIQAMVAQHPELTALSLAKQEVTYGQLMAQTEKLAARLSTKGVDKGDRVAVYLPRCLELLPALLACLRLDATYVPIDAGQPPERLRLILEDSSATCVVTNNALLEQLQEIRATKANKHVSNRRDASPRWVSHGSRKLASPNR